jgi:MYXO-CTERM domain-containing protein
MKRVGLAVLFAAMLPTAAQAITRTEVITSAKAYALHPWTSTTANQTASCSSSYKSLFPPGDYLGLPYGWGGYMTLSQFDAAIASGAGAGAQASDGVLACIAGVDCSGFVSSIWKSAHFTTSNIATVANTIAQADLLAGDILNDAGFHVAMYYNLLSNGTPVFYESAGYNVHQNAFGGWSYVMGYTPRRYNSIEGTTADDPTGTVSNPIIIGSLPYADDRNTANSSSRVFDRCALAPSTNESGPEYVYQLKLTQAGQLTVSVTDDAGSDMDVHLYSSFNTNDCMARNDTTFTTPVDCGTYYVVVDTFTNASGTALVGNYHVTVSLAPSGSACGAGPHVYNFPGKPGDACNYPGHTDLPTCNPTLGADTCIYSSSGSAGSFCSRACSTVNDCTGGGFAGGCCQDLGSGETYCMPASWCDPGQPMVPGDDGGTTSNGDAGTTSNADGGGTDPNGQPAANDGGDMPPSPRGHGCAMAPGETNAVALALLIALLALVGVVRRRGTFRD